MQLYKRDKFSTMNSDVIVKTSRDKLGRRFLVQIMDVDYLMNFNDLDQDEEFEVVKDVESYKRDIENWNKSIDIRLKNDSYDFDINKITEEDKSILKNYKLHPHNDSNYWLDVINRHNKGSWSSKLYCCLSEYFEIKQKLNKIDVMGFFKTA